MSQISVGVIQISVAKSVEKTKEKITTKIKKCVDEGANLILLQELHNTIYFCQSENVDYFDLAETIPGESTNYYGKLAKDLGVVIVLSLFEKRAKGLYHNTAVVIERDGRMAGKYRKMHIPDDPGFYEKFYFAPGDLGFEPIDTSLGKLGILICWDQWYPEAARLMALKGAELLIYPTAIGWDRSDSKEEQQRQLDSWMTIQRSHGVANAVPVISINRVGFEEDSSGISSGIEFWGNSFVCGAGGELIKVFSNKNEESAVITIDLEKTEHLRRIWPFFRDRRIDSYGEINKRYIDC